MARNNSEVRRPSSSSRRFDQPSTSDLTKSYITSVEADERGWSKRRVLLLGRLTTLLFIVIAALWPLVIRDFPGLFNYIQQVFSYAVPPIAAVFLLGMFWKRMTGTAAIATLVVGHAVGATILGWVIWTQVHEMPDGLPHFTIVAGLTTLMCFAVGIIVSWLTPQPSAARVGDGIWVRGDLAGRSGIGDYRWQATAVVAVVLALVWIFR